MNRYEDDNQGQSNSGFQVGEEDEQEMVMGTDSNEYREPNPLSRRSLLSLENTRRSLAIGGIALIGLGLLAAILFFGGQKTKKPDLAKEEFQRPEKRVIELPKASQPVLPSPVKEEKIDKEALALRDARLKSAILIYQNASSGNSNKSEASQISLSQDSNQVFQEQSQLREVPSSEAAKIQDLETKILQGKVIDAILETGINSDLPGLVRGIISHDVFGEAGKLILLPRGTRLIGTYNSALRKGQARVFVIWNRAIRPDGIEIALFSGGTDPLGQAGIAGKVNNHFWKIFGTSTLLSLIGAGAANLGVDSGDQNNSMSAYREEVANSFRDSATKVLDDYIDIPPTITVKPGTAMKILVARDLDFSEVLGRIQRPIGSGSRSASWVSHL